MKGQLLIAEAVQLLDDGSPQDKCGAQKEVQPPTLLFHFQLFKAPGMGTSLNSPDQW